MASKRSGFLALFLVIISCVIFSSSTSAQNNTVNCTAGTTEVCYNDIGLCEEGIRTCTVNGIWGKCIASVGISTEICDDLDNDCDGETDENLNCMCLIGDVRECGGPNVLPCKYGMSVCSGGNWSECFGSVEPANEICNGIDDNCDGDIDNVDFKTGVENTNCQCYGGGEPQKESCNGIDDDCDGRIDENSECCTPGDVRACGTSLGVCEKGTSECRDDYLWDDCEGAVESSPYELCGNGQDDNCDGKSDEYDPQCKACSNGMQDEFETGVDCGGPCQTICFFDLPWLIIFTAAAIMIVIIIFVIYPALQRRTIEIESV